VGNVDVFDIERRELIDDVEVTIGVTISIGCGDIPEKSADPIDGINIHTVGNLLCLIGHLPIPYRDRENRWRCRAIRVGIPYKSHSEGI
jgi:hypothetical protein